MASSKKWNLKHFERTVGGLKFAVILISLFTVMMIIGTFLESYHGADYAGRVIYKKWPFIAIQAGMFLSICFAAFLRLPPKKRLYGFYVIHSGLVIIGCGALVTYIAGIDGSMLLHPNEPTREIILNEDVLRLTYPSEGKRVTRDLPYTAFPAEIDDKYKELEFKTYLPYSENALQWVEPQKDDITRSTQSTQYRIANPNMSESFLLSLHPETIDYPSNKKLGPLNVNYLPPELGPCFGKSTEQPFILWNATEQNCTVPDKSELDMQTTDPGNRFFVYRHEGKLLTFFPDHSPWPLDEDLEVVKDSNIRLFNRKLFEDDPYLFLFGKGAAYYDEGTSSWEYHALSKENGHSLPWMGFELEVLQHETSKVPKKVPQYVTPIQQDGKLVKGAQKALKIEVEGREYWVTDQRPLTLLIRGEKVTIEVGRKELILPFEFVLTRFKMDTNPGTQSPASYESFVRLFTEDGPEKHHIYMNNPLKHAGFTFYQASYSKNADGSYSSTLSANVDPGRFWKYLGSLMLVLGATWHYMLNRKGKLARTLNKRDKSEVSEMEKFEKFENKDGLPNDKT